MANQIPIWQRIQEIKHEIGGNTISIGHDMAEGDIMSGMGEEWIAKNRKVCALLQEAEDLMTPVSVSLRNPAYDGPDGIFTDYMGCDSGMDCEPKGLLHGQPLVNGKIDTLTKAFEEKMKEAKKQMECDDYEDDDSWTDDTEDLIGPDMVPNMETHEEE